MTKPLTEEQKARKREANRKWREANRERNREADREWYEANRDRKREANREWYEANKDKSRERNREWYEANKDKARERDRQWREANRDKARGSKRAHRHARRARKRGNSGPAGSFTASALASRRALFDYRCAYCGDPWGHDDHLVALASGGANAPRNVVPACIRCNCAKGAKPVEAWYLSQSFYSVERWEKILANTDYDGSGAQQLSLLQMLCCAP